MRPLLGLLGIAALLLEAPVSAGITLPREPMSREQLEAVVLARALVEAMPNGVARQQASTFIAYRLMMRGDCMQALPVLNGELLDVADPKALGGLITGALTGRDPRCMAWVAARVDAILPGDSLSEDQRAELRLRGQTMFELVGQMTRAGQMPPADDEALETIPEGLRQRVIPLEGLTLHIGLSDAPTRFETLFIERLWNYRGTPLQMRLARAFATRAKTEPAALSSTG